MIGPTTSRNICRVVNSCVGPLFDGGQKQDRVDRAHTQHHNLPRQYSTPRPRTFLAESSSRSGDLEAFPPAVGVAVLQRLDKLAGVDRPA